MINFAVGPVMMSESVRKIGGQDLPYFRTEEFSSTMFENKMLFLKMVNAPEESEAVFLTSSGTGAMEAAVTNTLSSDDRVLVVNGGSFGERWVELCKLHSIRFTEIKVPLGKALDQKLLWSFGSGGYTALLVQEDETSTGEKFDIEAIGDFCKKNNIFFIIDGISSFLADPIDMEKDGIDVFLTGSQKGLAVPPGVALIALSPSAIDRAKRIDCPFMYFNFNLYIENMKRGQTPFTPAISVMEMINFRLKEVEKVGIHGAENCCASMAAYFRSRIKDLPLFPFPQTPSNALTALKVSGKTSAYQIFKIIKDEFDIIVCPNGGELADSVFRVGHMGNLFEKDYGRLIHVFHVLNDRGIL